MADVTRLLAEANRGDPQAAAKLLPLVYDELRKPPHPSGDVKQTARVLVAGLQRKFDPSSGRAGSYN